MIFKTLNGDLTIFNKTLISTRDNLKALQTVNATVYNKNGTFNLQGLLVNSSQSVSTFTKLNNALKTYNGNLLKSTQLQNAYIQAIGKQNTSLGNYLAGLNGAKASIRGYIKSLVAAKAASIGLQIASVALNTAISMGITLAISSLVSAITKWINKEKEAREEAIENAKTAKEEANNLSELLNKYNQLSREVKSNQGVKEDLLNVQSDLLEALGIEASQIDNLIEKYGDLNTAINQITSDSLRDAQGDLMAAVDAYEKDLINVGKSYANLYSITDRNILNATGDNSVKAFKILEKSGIINSGSYGTGGGALVLTGDDTVEGILENYQKLKDAQEALNKAIDNGEVTMEEMISNPLYQAINARLDQLNEAILNYNTAINDLNKSMAQQQILQSLSEQSSVPETKEEFEAFKQDMIDAAIASTKFKGSQDDVRDSIINALSTMHEFKKYFEELTDVQSSTLNNNPISFDISPYKDAIDDFQAHVKTLGDALSSIQSGEFKDTDFADLAQEFPELADRADNLEEAISEMLRNSLEELLKTLGENVPSGLANSLTELTEIALGVSKPLDDAFSSIQKSYDVLHDFKDVMESGFDDHVTDDLLSSVASLSGELNTMVAGFYAGAVTADELYNALTQHYEIDLENYGKALVAKNELNEDFYNNIGMTSAEVVEQFNKDYGIDLKNCKSYAEAKIAIEERTLKTISAAWSSYYDAQSRTFKNLGGGRSELEARAAHGSGDAAEILKQIDAYEVAMDALDDVVYHGLSANFEKISNKISSISSSSSSSIKDAAEETEEETKKVTELLDNFQSAVKSAQDAYSTLISGNYSSSELLDSIQAINQAMTDIGSSIDWTSMNGDGIPLAQLNETLEHELKKYAENILETAGIDVGSDFGQMLTNNIVQAQKATTQLEVLNDQIDSLQSSYEDLTDIVKTYNDTGYITFDQLQKLLEMEPQYLACLIDENGQLALNTDSMTALANQRLMDAAAQATNQAIVELGTLTLQNEQTAVEQNAAAFNNAISSLANYNAELANTIAEASVGASVIYDLNAAISGAEARGASNDQINTVLDNLQTKLRMINSVREQVNQGISGLNSVMTSSAYSSAQESAREFEETFDWIETAIDRIEHSISKLGLKADSVYDKWSDRNTALKEELSAVKYEIEIQQAAYERYMREADSIGLSEEWAKRVRNGQIDIISITNEALADQIKNYEKWYEKAVDCQDAIEELNETVSELYENSFDNVVTQYDNILSFVENSKNMLDKYINQSEEHGYIVNTAYYEALMRTEKTNIEQMEKERDALMSSLSNAIKSGAIEEGSQAWTDMKKQIDEVTLSIEEANTAMIQYGNSIRDIQWQLFDLLQDRISLITAESDFLIDLLSNDKLYDERGQLTSEGSSTMGLHGQNYNVYMEQADKYAKEILRINSEIANDPNNQDLIDRRNELLELQQESILAAENEKRAIVDMVEEGINLELESLKELIDTYNDALDAQKDLYDYQKNIAEQTKEIASLRKQLSAYEGDLSEESRARIQQIKVQLEEAEENLEETQYERYISDQKKLLDELYLEYETVLNQRLDDVNALIADMISEINQNASSISETLSSKAESVGYTLSESMYDIWSNSTDTITNVLEMYGSNLIGGIDNIDTSIEEVISGITDTADSIGIVNTTITEAVNNVTSSLQSILDTLSNIDYDISSSAKYSYDLYSGTETGSTTTSSASSSSGSYGGSSVGSSGNSYSSSPSSTVTSSTTTSSASSSSGSSGGFFIYKKNYYPRNKLNINTSIIDRLKYNDFDDSFSARKGYYSKMGLFGTYTGTNTQNAQMINWMKAHGYKNGVYNLKQSEWAWTQENGAEAIIRPSDGAVLTPLVKGDTVLNADTTRNLLDLINSPKDFIKEQMGNMVVPSRTVHDNISNDIQMTITLPNVQNYEQFKYAMQHDPNFEKMVQAMTVGLAAGKGSLRKYSM